MDKTYSCILVERREAAAWIRLNRPSAMNAISTEMLREIDDALETVGSDPRLCALVITGTQSVFSAGADLKEVEAAVESGCGFAGPGSFTDRLMRLLVRVEEFPKPAIAAVNGWALAGGFELAICCDLIIAGESARFGDAHANYGLLPSGGSSVRLPRLIGPMRAKQMMFSGDSFTAAQLQEFGLVTAVVPDGEVERAAHDFVVKLAKRSPLGLRRMKKLINESRDQPKASALYLEQVECALHATSHDMREGLSAFRAKRAPSFDGR